MAASYRSAESGSDRHRGVRGLRSHDRTIGPTIAAAALKVTLTPAGRRLRERALDIPPAIMGRLGMSLGELTDLRDRLTEVIQRTEDVPG